MDAVAIARMTDRTPRSAREFLAAMEAAHYPIRWMPSRRGHAHREAQRSTVQAFLRWDAVAHTSSLAA